jgi:hypothetical protein
MRKQAHQKCKQFLVLKVFLKQKLAEGIGSITEIKGTMRVINQRCPDFVEKTIKWSHNL